MNGNWTKNWKRLFIWASAYLSIIAFALVGGYVIVKDEDEGLKKETKIAFVVTLIFTALSAFLSIFYNFGSFGDRFYASKAYDFYDICTKLVVVAKIVVFAGFAIWAFFKKEKSEKTKTAEESKAE